MLNTTLNKIREFSPCEDGWKQLLTYLNKTKADDEYLDFKTILQAVGIKDAIWCLRTQEFKYYYKFVTRVAYSVLPIFEKKYPEDKRPRLAIEAIEKFMNDEISGEELQNAAADADAAARAADAAADAAARAVADAAADVAAYAAADAPTWAAAAAAAWAADAAADAAARAAAWADAWAAAARGKKWQEIEQIFIEECLN